MDYQMIKILCQKRGITIDSMAEQIGMSRTGLTASLKGGTLKVESLEKIAEVLGVSPCIFFGEKGVSQKIDFLREEVIGKSNVLINVELLLQELGRNLKLSDDFVKKVNEDICQKGYEIKIVSYGNYDTIPRVTKDMTFQLPQIKETVKELYSKNVDVKEVLNSIENEINILYKQYIDIIVANSVIKFLRDEMLLNDTSLLSSLSKLSIKYIGFKADGISKDYLSKFFNVKDIHDSFNQDMFDALDHLGLTALRRGVL